MLHSCFQDSSQGLVKETFNREVYKMLNLTIKPGEYFTIGEDIKVVFLGGTANNYKVMIDAPRSYNIVRGKVLEKNAVSEEEKAKLKKYYPEPSIPAEDMKRIISKQKRERSSGQQ